MKSLKNVFVNRTLNMRKILCIGFDMDHTLIPYNIQNFEKLVFQTMIALLVKKKNYPKEILNFKFNFNRTSRGLVIDTHRGNFLKLSRYRSIRTIYHGLTPIEYSKRRKLYPNDYIQLGASQSRFFFIESHFQTASSDIYMQLVELKKSQKSALPNFKQIFKDIQLISNQIHEDSELKSKILKNRKKYFPLNPSIAPLMENLIRHGKKLFLLTNSDAYYCFPLMDYTITPFLKKHSSWVELFDIIITSARKPSFFYEKKDFKKLNLKTFKIKNRPKILNQEVYKGGSALNLTTALNARDDEILYIGDQVYTDVVFLKQKCGWRTALVIEELEKERKITQSQQGLYKEIKNLMKIKIPLERKLNFLTGAQIENKNKDHQNEIQSLIKKIEKLDQSLSQRITKAARKFNPFWGELMRVGVEESLFASQAERFSCIYMSHITDFLSLSPREYYRAAKRLFPHEMS